MDSNVLESVKNKTHSEFYGLKTSLKPCKKRDPRVGDKFQVSTMAENKGTDGSRVHAGGIMLWDCTKLSDFDTERYLRFVERFFPKKEQHYSEERALYLLHLCEYDIQHAIQVLREKSSVQKNQSSDESESEEEEESSAEEDAEPDVCFICGDGGNLLICDAPGCNKVYHIHCVDLEEVPTGKWHCNWHTCNKCSNLADLKFTCRYCPNSLCTEHGPSKELSKSQKVEYLCEECRKSTTTPEQRFLNRLAEFNRRTRHYDNVRNKKLGKQPISLYRLFVEVSLRGGFDVVLKKKQWNDILREMKIDNVKPAQIRNCYKNSLLEYSKQFTPPEPTVYKPEKQT